ncbi:MAG: FG-GAP-like repeat-containing protein, partial [Rubripirellula sp.]
DVSDPTNISRLGSFSAAGQSATELFQVGNIVYLAETDATGTSGTMRILNFADPANIVDLGQFQTTDPINGLHIDHRNNSTIYLGTPNEVQAVDVSDPSNPTLLGSFGPIDARTVSFDQFTSVVSVGTPTGVSFLDVSNPASIAEIGTFATPGAVDSAELDGDGLFVTDESGTFQLAIRDEVSGDIRVLGTLDLSTPARAFGFSEFGFPSAIAAATGGVQLIELAPVGISQVTIANDDVAVGLFATDDNINIQEDDGPANFNVLTNDSPGTTIVSITPVTGGGTASFSATNVTFEPLPDAFGQASFGYTISDGTQTASAAVTFNIASVNDPPTAGDDTITITDRGPQTIAVADLLLDDSAGPGNENQLPTVTGVGANSANGGDLLFVLGETTISYTPDPAFTGLVDTFSYTISDGIDTAQGIVTVNLPPPVVAGSIDLRLTGNDFNDQPEAGGTLFDSYTIENLSATDAASNVVAVIALDSSTTFVSGSTSNGGTFIENGNQLTITIPSLAAGASETINLTLMVDAGASTGSLITSSGSVSATQADPNATNNTATSIDSVFGLHQLSTGTGDGDVTIDVDPFGSYGTSAFDNVSGTATFDPTGPIDAASAIFKSLLGIREGTTGPRLLLDDIPTAQLRPSSIAGDLTSATSTFSIGNFDVQLVQTVAPNFSIDGARNGSRMDQTYTVTNTSAQTRTLDVARYVDADLFFDGSRVDGGGRLTDSSGNLILFETDAGGTGATDATFLGITDQGGIAPNTDRFMVEDFTSLLQRVEAGTPLTDSIDNDGDNDGFVDAGSEYDVALALRRLLTIAPGQSVQYTNALALGAQPTSIVQQQQFSLTGHVSCDVNGNGQADAGEAVVGATVFLDMDDDRLLDANELSTLSDSNGDYAFVDVIDPTLKVVAEVPGNCNSVPSLPGVARIFVGNAGLRMLIDVGDLARSITSADVDGDGDQDLLVANEISNNIAVLENNEGNFTLLEKIDLGDRPQSVAAFQPTGATSPTIAVAAPGTPSDGGSIYMLNNSFSISQVRAGNGPIEVVLDDFDNNGEVDVITAAFRSSDLQLLLNGQAEPIVIDGAAQVITVDTGDADGDGNQDIVIAGYGYDDNTSELVVIRGDGTGDFADPVSLGDLNRLASARIVDLNEDPLDSQNRVFALSERGSMLIYNVENGALNEVGSFGVSDGATSFDVGDFNRDGLTDVAVANLGDQKIELYVGDGTGRFALVTTVEEVSAPADLVVADFNNDLADDIAVANFYRQTDSDGRYVLPSTATILLVDVAERSIVLSGGSAEPIDFVLQNGDPAIRLDVNGDQRVSMGDALRVINAMGRIAPEGEQLAAFNRASTDVDGDGRTSAIDALMIINHVSRQTVHETSIGFLQDDDDEDERFAAVDEVLANLLN